MNNLKIN